ncbi:MAG: hypothetical protein KBG15_05135 [Kofleriaceae bacterium]|nr:hypothetical protein [Kofleriaceae bacterium]
MTIPYAACRAADVANVPLLRPHGLTHAREYASHAPPVANIAELYMARFVAAPRRGPMWVILHQLEVSWRVNTTVTSGIPNK